MLRCSGRTPLLAGHVRITTEDPPNAINTFDPEVVALGGGVSAAGDLILEPAREVASRFVLPGVGERTEIRLSRYGPEAGLRGAALLAGQELEAERRGG